MLNFLLGIFLFAALPIYETAFAEEMELPQVYKAYGWVNFCHAHLSEDPDVCSSWIYDVDKKKERHCVLEETRFFIFPFSSLSKTGIAKLQPAYLKFVPTSTGLKCDYGVCQKCGKKLIRSFTWQEEVAEETEKCYRTENMPKILYKCDCVEEFIDKKDPAFDSIVSGWAFCSQPACYCGYFDKNISQYFTKFVNYLHYCSENPYCKCHWSETSCFRKKILDVINERFWAIVLKGKIHADSKDILPPEKWEKLLLFPQRKFLEAVVHTFFYSDLKTSLKNFDRKHLYREFDGCWLDNPISQADWNAFVDTTLFDLRPIFLQHYKECYKKHPHPRIHYEIKTITYDINH